MAYLLFNADRKFDDGYGGEVSLKDHLHYLSTSSGTPDSWDIVETDNISEVVEQAKASQLPLYIVDDCNYKIVGDVNLPEKVDLIKLKKIHSILSELNEFPFEALSTSNGIQFCTKPYNSAHMVNIFTLAELAISNVLYFCDVNTLKYFNEVDLLTIELDGLSDYLSQATPMDICENRCIGFAESKWSRNCLGENEKSFFVRNLTQFYYINRIKGCDDFMTFGPFKTVAEAKVHKHSFSELMTALINKKISSIEFFAEFSLLMDGLKYKGDVNARC